MAERERFIPRRVGRLTADLAGVPWPDDHDHGEDFRSFSRLTSALYHYEFHNREQVIIDAWEGADDDPEAADLLVAELTGLLDGANYTPVTAAELDMALADESLIPVRLEVDLDDYDEMLIYRRGSRHDTVEIPKWMGLRTASRTITVDQRVVVYTRVKPQSWFGGQEIDPAKRNLIPDHVSLKQFQNVPRADIEMLLPSTQVRLRLMDSLVVGVPAVASGVAVLATKLLPTLGLIFLLAAAWLGLRDEQPEIDQAALVILFGGVVTLGAFVVRQWTKLKNRRLDYLKTLTENLYLRTLSAGIGVFHSLLSAAEQQEVAEVLLAYRFLLNAPDGLNVADLDAAAETWLRDHGHGEIDFEVADAVAKLRRLDVIEGNPVMRALPLPESLALLDRHWDDIFKHQRSELVAPSPGPNEQAGADDSGGPRLIRLRRVIDRFSGRLRERRTEREAED